MGPSQAQLEKVTWTQPPEGPPPAGGGRRGWVQCCQAADRRGGPGRPIPTTKPSDLDMERHLPGREGA